MDRKHYDRQLNGLYKIELERGPTFYMKEPVYDQIIELLERGSCCKKCLQLFDETSPQVVKNMCQDCFHQMISFFHYDFLGMVAEDTYAWLERSKGNVYVTSTSDDITALDQNQEDHRETLKHYGFFFPEYLAIESENIYTKRHYLTFYGDPRSAKTMLVRLQTSLMNISTRREWWFFAPKGGTYRMIDFKKGEGRKVYMEAIARLKQQYGKYDALQHGHKAWEIMAEIISTLEN